MTAKSSIKLFWKAKKMQNEGKKERKRKRKNERKKRNGDKASLGKGNNGCRKRNKVTKKIKVTNAGKSRKEKEKTFHASYSCKKLHHNQTSTHAANIKLYISRSIRLISLNDKY